MRNHTDPDPQHTKQKRGGTCYGGNILWLGANIEEDGPLHPGDHEVGPLPNHLLLHALEPRQRTIYALHRLLDNIGVGGYSYSAVLRIQDVYPGSGFLPIPDPGSKNSNKREG
jgi:hypothetical protein